MFFFWDAIVPPKKKSKIVSLSIKSNTLGRTMSVDLEPLFDHKRFWEGNGSDKSNLWQVLANHYINLGFNEGLIDFLQFAIGTHAPKLDQHLDLVAKLPGNHKLQLAKLLKGVIDLSHHTDLVRCKVGPPKEPARDQIEEELHEFSDPDKINIKRATTNFLLHAIQACKMTGTRVKFQTYGKYKKVLTINPILQLLRAGPAAARPALKANAEVQKPVAPETVGEDLKYPVAVAEELEVSSSEQTTYRQTL